MGGEGQWTIALWLRVFEMGAMVVVAVYSWILSRTKANKTAIDGIASEVHGVQKRLTRLETDVKHLPSHHDMAALHEKVNGVSRCMENVRGELTGISRTLALIQQALLEDRKLK